MREIKFRGISIPDKKWIYGDLVTGDCYYNIGFKEEFKGYSILKSNLVITETVGQYTGLKDKNSIEIYEGDIITLQDVDYDNFLMEKVVVKYEGGSFIIKYGEFVYSLWNCDDYDIEVVGNIYENSEILNKGENHVKLP